MTHKSFTVVLGGGLNLVASSLQLKPGEALTAQNYEVDSLGNYRRMLGFERFDGRPRPSDASITDADTDEEWQTRLFAEIDARRAVIQAVPGAGPVRGVAMFKGVVYAWRDNAAGTALVMHKATATGWQAVAGLPALLPGGRVEVCVENFKALTQGVRLFGVDGVNKPFSFDGTTYTEITTAVATSQPRHIAAHSNHLFLAYPDGLLLHSGTGEPEDYTAVAGAADLGLGDEITGLLPQPGGALAIICRNSVHMLYGKDKETWDRQPFSRHVGGMEWSAQHLRDTLVLDEVGITALQRVQAFGNFEQASLSQKIRPLVEARRPKLRASITVRNKNQYRLFFSDGSGLIATFNGGDVSGWTTFDFGTRVAACTFAGEDADGSERLFMGGDDGFVYELERGRSFDGESIDATLRLAFCSASSPHQVKRWHAMTVEVEADELAEIDVTPDYDFSDANIPPANSNRITIQGGGSYFGQGVFGLTRFDSPAVQRRLIPIVGSSANLGTVFHSSSDRQMPHSLRALSLKYSYRGRTQ